MDYGQITLHTPSISSQLDNINYMYIPFFLSTSFMHEGMKGLSGGLFLAEATVSA